LPILPSILFRLYCRLMRDTVDAAYILAPVAEPRGRELLSAR
jgi:hypothetical protein